MVAFKMMAVFTNGSRFYSYITRGFPTNRLNELTYIKSNENSLVENQLIIYNV